MTTQVGRRGEGVELPALVVGAAFSLGALSEGRIMELAAAAAPDSDDPVDSALRAALVVNYPELTAPVVDAGDVHPAKPDRRYSVVRVRHHVLHGKPVDLVVLRGDLDAVLTKVPLGREKRSLIKRNAALVERRGWRPLAVATAEVGAGDAVGPFTVQGFLPVCPETAHASAEELTSGPADWARVRVWSASLRVQHWLNVALVFILSCSGFYIMDPFFGPAAHEGQPTGYLMGWVRLIHFTAAFVWLVVGLTRAWSAFTSRDRYLRWSSMWPLKKKEDVRNLGRILQHYVFIKKDAPVYLAHNPLQQLTYTTVYIAAGIQLVVGFMLFGLYHQGNAFWAFLSTPIHWIGVPAVRLIHTFIMFALWLFVIVHIYLVFRADSLERHGGLSAMINGGVWVKRGARPADAPPIK